MGYPKIAPAVIRELLKMQPGDRFTRAELAAATGFNEDQVAAVIGSRLRDGRLQADILERGYCWVFQALGGPSKAPDAKPKTELERATAEAGRALFESVRALPGGRVLLVDELGSLWVARHLEVDA